ncbi:aldehyde dehydrogenase family protein, partial [Nesterenkonia sp. F]|uniref:aldehyde dehydrogenase family protein n=1 Tax=Nesterenkonia sp. F TaxID=795955 RepID=UPI000255CF85
AISAVGFTGSRAAGTSLMAAAASREVPIPVYAEMSSINPVFVLDGAIADEDSRRTLAEGYLASVKGSAGQLCTVPGLAFVPEGEAGDAFVAAVGEAASSAAGQTMLTSSIAESWQSGVTQLGEQAGVEQVGRGVDGGTHNAPAPVVFTAGSEQFLTNPALHEEIFGAASLVVRYRDAEDLVAVAQKLEGQLTATLQMAESDHDVARSLLPVLEQKAGRLLANGWPTGVEVGEAMVHGGPFPATSDGRTTSVGTLAIERFLRPVAYQNIPEDLLPEPVQEANPWGLTRRVDGTIIPAD